MSTKTQPLKKDENAMDYYAAYKRLCVDDLIPEMASEALSLSHENGTHVLFGY